MISWPRFGTEGHPDRFAHLLEVDPPIENKALLCEQRTTAYFPLKLLIFSSLGTRTSGQRIRVSACGLVSSFPQL